MSIEDKPTPLKALEMMTPDQAQITILRYERDAARALADRLAEALEDAAWYHDKDFPDRTCTSCYDWASALAAYKERGWAGDTAHARLL